MLIKNRKIAIGVRRQEQNRILKMENIIRKINIRKIKFKKRIANITKTVKRLIRKNLIQKQFVNF